MAGRRVENGASGGQMKRAIGSYGEDNLKSDRVAGDDTGLPESPIYSNFSKHLWRTHTRLGLERAPEGSREPAGGIRPPKAAESTLPAAGDGEDK